MSIMLCWPQTCFRWEWILNALENADMAATQRCFQKRDWILTDEISKSWAGLTTKEYKNLKGLKKENLRDNMTNLELVLNMLAEASTAEISKQKEPETFEEYKTVAQQDGQVANAARKQLEETTGKKVVTIRNAKSIKEIKE